jgi:hypothetical protein
MGCLVREKRDKKKRKKKILETYRSYDYDNIDIINKILIR